MELKPTQSKNVLLDIAALGASRVFIGFTTLGAILDAVSNAFALVSSTTSLVLLSLILLGFLLGRNKKVAGRFSKQFRVLSPWLGGSKGLKCYVFGVVLVLALPLIANALTAFNEHLAVKVSEPIYSRDEQPYGVHSVPARVDFGTYKWSIENDVAKIVPERPLVFFSDSPEPLQDSFKENIYNEVDVQYEPPTLEIHVAGRMEPGICFTEAILEGSAEHLQMAIPMCYAEDDGNLIISDFGSSAIIKGRLDITVGNTRTSTQVYPLLIRRGKLTKISLHKQIAGLGFDEAAWKELDSAISMDEAYESLKQESQMAQGNSTNPESNHDATFSAYDRWEKRLAKARIPLKGLTKRDNFRGDVWIPVNVKATVRDVSGKVGSYNYKCEIIVENYGGYGGGPPGPPSTFVAELPDAPGKFRLEVPIWLESVGAAARFRLMLAPSVSSRTQFTVKLRSITGQEFACKQKLDVTIAVPTGVNRRRSVP